MPRNLNLYACNGRLGDFPDMRYMPNGTAITRLRVAVQDDYYNQSESEWVERTQWLNVTFFGNRAESIANSYGKGDLISLVAKLENNSYEKDGVTVHTYNIIGERISLLQKANRNEEANQDTTRRSRPSQSASVEEEEDIPF